MKKVVSNFSLLSVKWEFNFNWNFFFIFPSTRVTFYESRWQTWCSEQKQENRNLTHVGIHVWQDHFLREFCEKVLSDVGWLLRSFFGERWDCEWLKRQTTLRQSCESFLEAVLSLTVTSPSQITTAVWGKQRTKGHYTFKARRRLKAQPFPWKCLRTEVAGSMDADRGLIELHLTRLHKFRLHRLVRVSCSFQSVGGGS